MPAVSVTGGSRREIDAGNIRMVIETITSVADGNTYQPGLDVIEQVVFTPRTSTAWGMTFTNRTATTPSTVTFAVAAGTLAGQVITIGY